MAKLKVVEQSLMPGIPVVSAFLHQAVQMPGFGSVEKSINESKMPGVRLSFDNGLLWIEYKGKRGFVPSANVAGALI